MLYKMKGEGIVLKVLQYKNFNAVEIPDSIKSASVAVYPCDVIYVVKGTKSIVEVKKKNSKKFIVLPKTADARFVKVIDLEELNI